MICLFLFLLLFIWFRAALLLCTALFDSQKLITDFCVPVKNAFGRQKTEIVKYDMWCGLGWARLLLHFFFYLFKGKKIDFYEIIFRSVRKCLLLPFNCIISFVVSRLTSSMKQKSQRAKKKHTYCHLTFRFRTIITVPCTTRLSGCDNRRVVWAFVGIGNPSSHRQ